MSKFTINDYLTEEEKKVISKSEETTDQQKTGREIQISSLEGKPASEIVALALIEALKQDTESFTELDQDKDGIFSQVRIIAKEDINENPTKAASFARGADTLIIPNQGLNSFNEEFFINNAELETKQVFNSVESFINHMRDKFPSAKKLEINAVATESNQLDLKDEADKVLTEAKGLKLGDIVTYGGRKLKVKYLDEYVLMIHACDHEGTALPIDYHVVRYNDVLKADA